MKIFWSWQSDTPGKTGRHFIRQALADAISALKQTEDVEEPIERENKDALHLDHDREGVSGSPDLARLILDKIDASSVFVADVTPVSTIPARPAGQETIPEKRNMNPNVAIELGYALRGLSDRNVLMVLNTYYGDRSHLPFDLAHKAGPILFDLALDADKETRNEVAAALTGRFIVALRPYLQAQSVSAPVAAFPATPSTVTPAIYFKPNEPLAEFGEESDRVEYSRPDGRGFYLRVIPRGPLPQPFTRSELLGSIRRVGLRPLWRNPSGLFAANGYGAIVVEPESVRGGAVQALAQVFANGEVWALAPWLLKDNAYGKFVPGQAFETTFRARLEDYVALLAEELRIPLPFTVEAGAVGLKGMRIVVDQNPDTAFGPIHDDAFRVERVLNDSTEGALDQVALDIFEAFFRASGYRRPQGLFGFPPA